MSTHPPSELLAAIAAKERELDALRRRLAAFREASRLPEGPIGVVSCRLGPHRVAFLQDDVDEVVAMAELSTLPGSPEWLTGLLTVGRERLPVLDLAALETGRRRVVEPSEHILLARSRGRRFGLVVDEVESLDTILGSDVRRPSAELPYASHVVGVVTVGSTPRLLLAVEPIAADLPVGEEAP